MKKSKNLASNKSQQGAVLLEAMIAILIFSMGVLGIVGLQASMVKNVADSKFRTEASNIAQQRIGQIWADPDPTRAGYVGYVENNTDISTLLPNGTRTTAQSGVQFTVTVNWQQPGEASHSFSTIANITGG